MKETTKLVIELRKKGKTYADIVKETGLSKGNISYICRKYIPVISKLQHKANRVVSEDHLQKMRKCADAYYASKRQERKTYWASKLKTMPRDLVSYVAGLYDGEGNHSGTEFRLANSSKDIVLTFVKFLDLLEAPYTNELYLHSSQSKEKCLAYWDQLTISCVRQQDTRQQSRNYKAKENYGTIHTRVCKPLGLNEAVKDYSFSYNCALHLVSNTLSY